MLAFLYIVHLKEFFPTLLNQRNINQRKVHPTSQKSWNIIQIQGLTYKTAKQEYYVLELQILGASALGLAMVPFAQL